MKQNNSNKSIDNINKGEVEDKNDFLENSNPNMSKSVNKSVDKSI